MHTELTMNVDSMRHIKLSQVLGIPATAIKDAHIASFGFS